MCVRVCGQVLGSILGGGFGQRWPGDRGEVILYEDDDDVAEQGFELFSSCQTQ